MHPDRHRKRSHGMDLFDNIEFMKRKLFGPGEENREKTARIPLPAPDFREPAVSTDGPDRPSSSRCFDQ